MILPAGVGGEAGHETSLDIVHRVPILCVCVCVCGGAKVVFPTGINERH